MSSTAGRCFPDVDLSIDPGIEPYWKAAADGRLVLSRCARDGAALWPPRSFCPRHMDAGIRWESATGGGQVYSYSVVNRGEGAFAAVAPYVLAYVELDEGPRVLTDLVTPAGEPATDAHIGQRVTARFDLSVGVPVLRFALST